MAKRRPAPEIAGRDWRPLYKLGALTALLMVILTIAQFIVVMVAPPPYEGSAFDWFMLFQSSRLIGLLDFELLMVVYVILSLPTTLALYALFRQTSPSLTTLYVALSLVGTVSFITARPAFEMLALSDAYAAATTDAQRAIYLSAGEGQLAVFHGTAFYVSYLLGSIGGLIISLVILKTDVLGKAAAYLRFASSVFDLGLFVPTIGLFISAFSVVFLLVWNILIAYRLFQLGKAS